MARQTQLETILTQTGAQPAGEDPVEISNHNVNVIIMYNEAIENMKWKKLKFRLEKVRNYHLPVVVGYHLSFVVVNFLATVLGIIDRFAWFGHHNTVVTTKAHSISLKYDYIFCHERISVTWELLRIDE